MIIWTDYMKYRAELRGFNLVELERIIENPNERYYDTMTGRSIVFIIISSRCPRFARTDRAHAPKHRPPVPEEKPKIQGQHPKGATHGLGQESSRSLDLERDGGRHQRQRQAP